MAAILAADAVMDVFGKERHFREDAHAVVGFHAVEMLVDIAFIGEYLRGEMFVRRFGFLQADNIRIKHPHHIDHDGGTKPDGIDIPSDDFH